MKREIHIKPSSGFPYLGTDVPFEQSIEDIKKLLRKFGCQEILTYEQEKSTTLMFKDKSKIPYKLEFPTIYIDSRGHEPRLAMDVSGRVIYNEIKAMLVNVEIGFLDFMQAMLRYVALPAPQGRGIVTLGEVVESQRETISRGGMVELNPEKLKLLEVGGKA